MHNIQHATYPENVNRDKVQKYWDAYAAREDAEEGCTGLAKPIRWLSGVCKSYDEAVKQLEDLDTGWYDQLAIRFLSPKEGKISKALEEAKMRVAKAQKDVDAFRAKNIFVGRKSKTVGCEKCGSSLAVEYMAKLNRSTCPVCLHDLHSASWKNEMNSKKAKLEAAEAKLAVELAKNSTKNYEVLWLVKIEYHT